MSTWNEGQADGIILNVSSLTCCYGKMTALKGIDFHVYDHEILGIVGPNGAGKTTLLESIAGTGPIAEGQIEFLGRQIGHWPVLRRRQLGLVLIPQDGYVFPMMSAKKNLEVSLHLTRGQRRQELPFRASRLRRPGHPVHPRRVPAGFAPGPVSPAGGGRQCIRCRAAVAEQAVGRLMRLPGAGALVVICRAFRVPSA